MKKVTFRLLRHAKDEKSLEATLPAEELKRAGAVGARETRDYTKVGYSPLARAIQTALAAVLENFGVPEMLEAEPAFGTLAMLAEMVAPSQFQAIASVKGNYQALYDVHDRAKVYAWRDAMVAAFDKLFVRCVNSDFVLLSIHSPSVEMTIDGLMQRQDEPTPPECLTMAELDSVLVEATQEADGAPINVKIIEKTPAPAVE
jgi:hypothetical protein